jgi:hypothetical protein
LPHAAGKLVGIIVYPAFGRRYRNFAHRLDRGFTSFVSIQFTMQPQGLCDLLADGERPDSATSSGPERSSRYRFRGSHAFARSMPSLFFSFESYRTTDDLSRLEINRIIDSAVIDLPQPDSRQDRAIHLRRQKNSRRPPSERVRREFESMF